MSPRVFAKVTVSAELLTTLQALEPLYPRMGGKVLGEAALVSEYLSTLQAFVLPDSSMGE